VLQTTGYAQEKSETAAWEPAIRHLGVDTKNENGDCVAIAKDGIKGVNWLTILDSALVARIKIRPEFTQLTEDDVEVIPLSKGLLLKAGAEPAIGMSIEARTSLRTSASTKPSHRFRPQPSTGMARLPCRR